MFAVLKAVTDAKSASVTIDKDGVQQEDRADLVIGADGLRSRIRESLGFGAADSAVFLGKIAFRAILSTDDVHRRLRIP